MKRRTLIIGMLRAAAVAAVSQGQFPASLTAETSSGARAMDPRRPQYHFLPASNWMNDPNGPIYFRGNYHLFYQYNPKDAVWGDMHWGHAISSDMMHWKHLPVALSPTPGGPDSDGCFTGTAVVDDDKVVLLYTGVRRVPYAQATNRDGAFIVRETQCLATSVDPELRIWTKSSTPVIASPPAGMQVNGFRDPSLWRQGDCWYMVIGAGIVDRGGAVLLYRSNDLHNWEYLHIFAQRDTSIAAAAPYDPWEVWECPEFFPLVDRYVLIYSAGGLGRWQVGMLDERTMQFHPERGGILDYRSFYAPKTQLDKNGNRILWGWIPETRSEAEHKAAGWAGMMSTPRVLTLDSDNRLKFRVAAEVDGVRGPEQTIHFEATTGSKQSQTQSHRIEGCCCEILCAVQRGNEPFQLILSDAQEEESTANAWITLQYDPLHAGQIEIDGRIISLLGADGEALELHLFIDGSVIEAFVDQQVAFTKRFYYAGNKARDLRVQWVGSTKGMKRLSLWQLSPISADRLTS